MQIAFHIGANCTDEDRLLKSLLKNADVLSGLGIKVPGPGKYRKLIRETLHSLNGAPPAPNARQVLLDAILDEDEPERLVLSNANFICIPNRIFDEGRFYVQAEFKVRSLLELFPQDQITFYLGLRDPATFLPEAYAQSKAPDFASFIQGTPLGDIRWSDVIARIRQNAPAAEVVVWCNEDTPLIWADLIRRIAGIDRMTKITGGFDLLAHLMSADGLARFLAYLRDHPPRTETQKRRIIAAFLDKYTRPEDIETEVDLPGFDAATVQELSLRYDEDVALIARMPGVTLVTP